MNNIEFKKLLFKIAFSTMACDGVIQPEEIEEMKLMDKNTSFFEAIDLTEELSQLVEKLDKIGSKLIIELFDDLKNHDLDIVQELIILEVSLRIINADKKQDENEIKFIHLLRSKLKVHDETILERFGPLEILHTHEYASHVKSEEKSASFIRNLTLPDVLDIKNINLKEN